MWNQVIFIYEKGNKTFYISNVWPKESITEEQNVAYVMFFVMLCSLELKRSNESPIELHAFKKWCKKSLLRSSVFVTDKCFASKDFRYELLTWVCHPWHPSRSSFMDKHRSTSPQDRKIISMVQNRLNVL